MFNPNVVSLNRTTCSYVGYGTGMLPQEDWTLAKGFKDVATDRMFLNATRMLQRELECFNGFWTLLILGPGCSTWKWNAPHVTGLIRILAGMYFWEHGSSVFLTSFIYLLTHPAARQAELPNVILIDGRFGDSVRLFCPHRPKIAQTPIPVRQSPLIKE